MPTLEQLRTAIDTQRPIVTSRGQRMLAAVAQLTRTREPDASPSEAAQRWVQAGGAPALLDELGQRLPALERQRVILDQMDQALANGDPNDARLPPLMAEYEQLDAALNAGGEVFDNDPVGRVVARCELRANAYERLHGVLQGPDSTAPTWTGPSSDAIFRQVPGLFNAANMRDTAARFQLAIQAFTEHDGQVDTGLYGEEGMEMLIQDNLTDHSTFTACHPTAQGLQGLLGRPETEVAAGGAGADGRRRAVALATEALASRDRLSIIWVKSTATNDGHSFSLLMNHGGTVTSLEGWAMNPERNCPCGLVDVFGRPNRPPDMSNAEASAALTKLLSDDSAVRDDGYKAMSVAYGREPGDQPAHHFEERDNNGTHDARENHSLEVTVRELRPRPDVEASLDARAAALTRLVPQG